MKHLEFYDNIQKQNESNSVLNAKSLLQTFLNGENVTNVENKEDVINKIMEDSKHKNRSAVGTIPKLFRCTD